MRLLETNPEMTQRELAEALGVSLGAANYCLKALKKKGLIKVKNFKKNKNKLRYMYYLTPKGFSEKTRITIRFMKSISEEYENLKKDSK